VLEPADFEFNDHKTAQMQLRVYQYKTLRADLQAIPIANESKSLAQFQQETVEIHQ